MIIIDIPKLYDFVQQIVIDGVIYHIRLTLNEKFDYWNFSLYDADRDPIIEMIRLVPDFELLKDITDYRLPTGVFGCSSNGQEITSQSLFNGDATLVYFSRDEWEELKGAELDE